MSTGFFDFSDEHEAQIEALQGIVERQAQEIDSLQAKNAAYGITQSLAEVLLKIDLTAISPVEALTRLSELKHTVKNMLAKTGDTDVS